MKTRKGFGFFEFMVASAIIVLLVVVCVNCFYTKKEVKSYETSSTGWHRITEQAPEPPAPPEPTPTPEALYAVTFQDGRTVHCRVANEVSCGVRLLYCDDDRSYFCMQNVSEPVSQTKADGW